MASASLTEKWNVYREDDNGVVARMFRDLSKDTADKLVIDYTARGHKQRYWADIPDADRDKKVVDMCGPS